MCSKNTNILALSVVALAGASCSTGLDGPTPSLALTISPEIVCNQQLSTTLDITGKHFSPVPANVPDGPRLLLPTFTLASQRGGVTLVYNGDPKQSDNVKALRWLSETHMQATLDDQRLIDGKRGHLPAGVYDAHVVNPNGHEDSAEAALTVVDKPSLSGQDELLACASRIEQELVIEGTGFLRYKDKLPSLQLDGLSVRELTECTDLSDDAAICRKAQLTVSNQFAAGIYEAKLVNPEPAACQTEETLQIRVIAGPQLESNPVDSVCLRGQTRVLIVRGKGFQQLDGALPSASIAGRDLTVVALDDCEPETGATRSCKKMQIELPTGNLGENQAATTLTVSNPAPLGCSVSANLQLRELLQKQGTSLRDCSER